MPPGKSYLLEIRETSQRVVSATAWGDRWTAPAWPGALAAVSEVWVRASPPPCAAPLGRQTVRLPRGVPLCCWLVAAASESPGFASGSKYLQARPSSPRGRLRAFNIDFSNGNSNPVWDEPCEGWGGEGLLQDRPAPCFSPCSGLPLGLGGTLSEPGFLSPLLWVSKEGRPHLTEPKACVQGQ